MKFWSIILLFVVASGCAGPSDDAIEEVVDEIGDSFEKKHKKPAFRRYSPQRMKRRI